MTTAYMAELDTALGTRFISKGGKVVLRPAIFSTSMSMLKAIDKATRAPIAIGVSIDKIAVIVIKDLEKGIRASAANVLSYREFRGIVKVSTMRVQDLDDAQYKIQLSAPQIQKNSKRLYGCGPDAKFGKTWNSAGRLRIFIASNINLLKSTLANATVLEYNFTEDGITPLFVKRVPIIEFYRRSPDSNKRYQQFFGGSLSDDIPEFRSTLA